MRVRSPRLPQNQHSDDNMRFLLKPIILVLFASPLSLLAQDFFYWQAPREPLNRVTVGARYMFPVDISFSNLGSVPLRDIEVFTRQGTFEGRVYNDGQVLLDSTYFSGFESDGQTTAFTYNNASQVQGNQITYTQYGSTSDGHGVNTDSDGTGWEIQWMRYVPRFENFGFIVGFSVNELNAGERGEFTGTLLRLQDTYDFGNNPIPPIPAGQSRYTGLFSRSRPGLVDGREPNIVGPQPVAPINPSNEAPIVLEPLVGGAEGFGIWELNSAFYTFRLGPVYDWKLGRSFSVHMGAGVAASFMSGNFTVTETLDLGEDDPAVYFGIDRSSEILLGGYLDASANYQMTERVSLFSGLQYQSSGDFTGHHGDRKVDVNLGGTVNVRAGFGVRF